MKKFYIHTLGCKLNFAESSKLKQDFENQECIETKNIKEADYILINTCSVTASADKKGRYLINQSRRQNATAKIITTGCYSQLKPEKIKELNNVDLILGNEEKANFATHLSKIQDNKSITERKDYKSIKTFSHAYSYGDRTRTFLKIQDGCDYFCAYCTIPMARGKSRSGNIESVINDLKDIESKNIKEVILTGINIGDFGNNTNETLIQLFKIIEENKFRLRIRISSIEPNLLTNEIIDLVSKSKIFMPHFHIPLQCGTDKLLKLMGRRYDLNTFENKVKYIIKKLPFAFIGVDLISGVPNETDEDFKNTCEFVEKLDISELHIFTYSERDNTRAKKMGNQVSPEIKKIRSSKLQNISKKKLEIFYKKNNNREFTILFEHKDENDMMSGFTENYIKITKDFDAKLVGELSKIKFSYKYKPLIN